MKRYRKVIITSASSEEIVKIFTFIAKILTIVLIPIHETQCGTHNCAFKLINRYGNSMEKTNKCRQNSSMARSTNNGVW